MTPRLLAIVPLLLPTQFLPPGHLASGWTLDALEDQCSVEGMNFDAPCLKGIRMDLGAAPVVITERLPAGGSVETVKYLEPDYARAEALMQQACAYHHWESCMQYGLLLEAGKHFAGGKQRAAELTQWACSEKFGRACEALSNERTPLVAPAKSPIWVWTGRAMGPARLPEWIKQPEEARALAPQPKAKAKAKAKAKENEGVARVMALLKAQCEKGEPGACDSLPRNALSAPPTPKPPEPSVNGAELRALCHQMLDMGACYGLAKAIEDGRLQPLNPQEAPLARQNACKMGVEKACVR